MAMYERGSDRSKDDEKVPVGARKGKGAMKDEDRRKLVAQIAESCVSFVEDTLAPLRTSATDYYHGKPFGNEQRGRSQVVSTEVRDTVRAMEPPIMRVIFGPEQVVEFVPTGPGGEEQAEAQTKSVNYVFTEDNNGFLETLAVLKDGLIRRLGAYKVWWEKGEDVPVADCLTDLDEQTMNQIVAEKGITPTRVETDAATGLSKMYFTAPRDGGRVRLRSVPSEEIVYNPEARSVEEALCIGTITPKTTGDLIAMGVSEKDIKEHGGLSSLHQDNPASETRRDEGDERREDVDGGESNDEHSYGEFYMNIDVDGDGVNELRRVCTIGPKFYEVENEPAPDGVNLVLFCPFPEPHTLNGRSVADLTMDLQKISSSILRATLDSLALSIFPRTVYVDNAVNAKDILNTAIGAPIREKAPGMVRELTHTFVGREAMPILQFFREIGERRTGIAAGASDLDMDALQSTTKSAADAAISASSAQLELTARVFAEMTLKPLFKLISALLKKNSDKGRWLRVHDTWVEMKPSEWTSEDVRVRVMLGSMLVEKKLEVLAAIATRQENIITQAGPDNPVVSLAQLRYTYAKAAELCGYPDASKFFKVVPKDWKPAQPEPQPNPEIMAVQIEGEKAKARQQLDEQKAQFDAQVRSRELELKERELALKEQQAVMDNEKDLLKIETDKEVAIRELELKYQLEGERARIDADIRRSTAAASQELAQAKAGHSAGIAERKQEHNEIVAERKLEQSAAESRAE